MVDGAGTGFDFDRFVNVQWLNNGINIDGQTPPIPTPSFEAYCDNDIDDDEDGDTDCEDSDCFCN